MNKYIISRTSVWEGKPCEEAFEENVTCYSFCTCKTLEEANRHDWFKRDGSFNHIEINGQTRHSYKDKEWVIQAESIEALYKKYGRLVVGDSECEEYPISIEIYDDYRE